MDFFNLAMGFMKLLGDENKIDDKAAEGLSDMANSIFQYASYILIPIMVVVGVAGIFYSVYLGVQLAKADSADKRQEAKSRMVNAIIGFVVIFVLVLLMYLFCSHVDDLFGWTKTQSNPTSSGSGSGSGSGEGSGFIGL